MTEIDRRVLAAFQAEHKEQLEGIRAILAAGPGADLEEVFRLAHSLKGGARVCGLRPIEALGHQLETLFARVRDGGLPLDPPALAVVHGVLDAVEDWMAARTSSPAPPEPAQALAAIERLLGAQEQDPCLAATRSGARVPEALRSASRLNELDSRLRAAFQTECREYLEGIRALLPAVQSADGTALAEVFRQAHSLKGAARVVDLPVIEKLGQRLETLFSRIRQNTLTLDPPALAVVRAVLDAIETWMAGLASGTAPPTPTLALTAIERLLGMAPETPAGESPEPAASQPLDMVRLSADSLDRLLRSSGQLLAEGLRQDQLARALHQMSQQIADLEKEWDTVRQSCKASLHRLAALPEFARLSRYLEQAGHQVRGLSRQARTVRLLQRRGSWSLRLLGDQLQRDVQRARMVPAESVFQGFRKMMRDLAHDEGKEIDFQMTGLDVQADRLVLQALKDPVMHALRNAASHGIEAPAERQARAKTPAGAVSLRIEALGNRLRLRIEDDGRGIDYERVADLAGRRGLLSGPDAGTPSPEDLGRVLFQPGFSTARVVTELAGRGMGLSVVAEVVARLQGEVHLGPRAGGGTSLVLSVPLSVSAHRLLLIACSGQTFAIPLHGIEQLLRVKVRDVETMEGKPVIVLKDRPVPLLNLAHLLKMGTADIDVEGEDLHLVILRAGTKLLAAAVDAFVAEREGLIKDLEGPAATVRAFAGAILLDDGTVALVLNPLELIEGYQPSHQATAVRSVTPQEIERTPRVLVVDDSFTTRTLEKSILEAHGYEVRVAVDGVDALLCLRSEKVDLVITDVQMPRMDGFALLAEMKRDPRLTQVPVILVTSLDRREDQERGLALGAEAYIVKRKFDHQDLLDTIRQIL